MPYRPPSRSKVVLRSIYFDVTEMFLIGNLFLSVINAFKPSEPTMDTIEIQEIKFQLSETI